MAESFTNALKRTVGFVTTSPSGSIGITTDIIAGVSTALVSAGDLVDNQNFVGGTRVTSIGVGNVTVDTQSTNTAATSSQVVNFVGLTTVYVSNGVKSILIGGTLSNNTSNQIAATVQVASGTTSYNLLYKVPVPAGSSVIISDAGKTLLLPGDEIRIASNSNNSLDVSLSILTGVN